MRRACAHSASRSPRVCASLMSEGRRRRLAMRRRYTPIVPLRARGRHASAGTTPSARRPWRAATGRRWYMRPSVRRRRRAERQLAAGTRVLARGGAGEQRQLAAEGLARRARDLHADELPGRGRAGEVHGLVVARAAPQARGVGPRAALDEHLELAADEALRALVGAALDDLDEALHALDLDLVCDDSLAQRTGLGPAARREDERERAVVADLFADGEGLCEVLLGLAREADDDVGRDRGVGHVLTDERDAVKVTLARVGAAHRLQDPRGARLQ